MRRNAQKLRAYNRRLIIPPVARRIHIPVLHAGDIALDAAQAHHARDVLRLADGAEVEAFDDHGATAAATLIYGNAGETAVRVAHINVEPARSKLKWIVASAVPKGDRADWMIEKLSELGASAFIPLETARAIVIPEGKNKRDRWTRIAIESAKQSRRHGVMTIEPLTLLMDAIQIATAATGSAVWVFTTELAGKPIREMIAAAPNVGILTLFIGPEGGWTPTELTAFEAHDVSPVRLGDWILLIETAAVASAAIVSAWLT